MIIITRYLTLLGMLATVAWFLWNPDKWEFKWDPVVVFILTLAGFIATDVSIQKRSGNITEKITHKNDAILFRKLIKLLPSTGPIGFLAHHHFLLSFKSETIKPFHEFVYYWNNAEHEFIDDELEKLRSELYQSTEELLEAIGQYTSPNSSGNQAVRNDFGKHEPVHEERYKKEAEIINSAAKQVVKIHQKLFRFGREKYDFSENIPND